MTTNGSRQHASDPSPGAVALPVDDLIEDALAGLRPQLTGRRVSVFIARDLPLVQVDPTDAVRALGEAVASAAAQVPSTSELLVSATAWQRAVEIRVAARGVDTPPVLTIPTGAS